MLIRRLRNRVEIGGRLERTHDLMGHSQLQVTEHYAYTLKDSLLRDMDAIDAVFAAVPGPPDRSAEAVPGDETEGK